MRPLFIVGTARNVGKTTLAIGLLHALRSRGLRVGYFKPVGQRLLGGDSGVLHEDARLVASHFGPGAVHCAPTVVPLPRGRVEQEIGRLRPAELVAQIQAAYEKLAGQCDLVIVEGLGHVATGACLKLSAGDVCRALGARVLLAAGGGIGRTIDEVDLCATFVRAHGGDLAGVVVNKVWPDKYLRVCDATQRGLANLGIELFGTIPYCEQLVSPMLQQVHECIGGQVIGGYQHMDHRVRHILIAAMDAGHVARFIKGNTLIITPGDRSDTIRCTLRAHMLGDRDLPAVSGLLLTDGFPVEPSLAEAIRGYHLPTIAVKEDAFAVASKVVNTVFKIIPSDSERILWAITHVVLHVNVDRLLETLSN